MKTIRDVLTSEQIEKYRFGWDNFKEKYTPNTSYNVHSGMPVISQVYRFEDTFVFRAHIFNKRMRKFDPYHMADKTVQAFWHAQHYLMVAEQMYTASSRIVINTKYNRMIAKDVPVEFRWKKPLFWSDTVSVELIREELGNIGPYEKQAGYFSFYSDKTDSILSRMSAYSFWQKRAYVNTLEKIRKGEAGAFEELIRKIESQEINQKRLKNPRKNLLANSEWLIKELNAGNIPEKEIHDFFSLWEE